MTTKLNFSLLFFLLSFSILSIHCSSIKHYSQGEVVDIYVNRVGPYNNPQEFYLFHRLPYCKTELNNIGKRESLGESILGYELRKFISAPFQAPILRQQMCEIELDQRSISIFKYAIDHQYWFQLFADNLPVWGIVGDKVNNGGRDEYRLYTHLHFDISFNFDQIIEVNMTSENAIELGEAEEDTKKTLPFSYSIQWIKTEKESEKRFEKYLNLNSNEEIAHWFHLLNSTILILFLMGLVTLIFLKTLKKEFSYSEDDSEEDLIEETGWKLLQREVFRSPPSLELFAGLLGSGSLLFFSSIVFFFFAISFPLYSFRGSLLSTFITAYVLLSFISGYVSGRYYIKQKGTKWIKTALVGGTIVPLTLFSIAFVMNITAKSFASLSHIPFASLLIMVGVWGGMMVEVMAGTLFGRHWNKNNSINGGSNGNLNHMMTSSSSSSSVIFNRTNLTPRLIPKKGISLHPIFHLLLTGILPFSSILIELHLIFHSLFSYRYYYSFGYLFYSFFILSFAVSSISIISTYFILNNEDHRWQWRSFGSGASISIYVFFYSIYFYIYQTNMSGFLQFVLYFGDVAIISFLLAVLCGSLSFFAANFFVHRIYNLWKSE